MGRLAGVACVVVGLTVAAPAQARPRRKPTRGAVHKLLKATLRVKSVTDVLADLGGGRFPVLFFTGDKDCETTDMGDVQERACSPTTAPWVAIVDRAAGGQLSLEAKLELPTVTPAWDVPDGQLGWGITFVKDYDHDGKPELMVLYGYNGPMEPAVGDTHYRDICLVNLDKLSLAFHVTVDQEPQADVFDRISTKWKLVPAKDRAAAPTLVLTRTTARGDDPDHREKVETIRYRHDAGTDTWIKE